MKSYKVQAIEKALEAESNTFVRQGNTRAATSIGWFLKEATDETKIRVYDLFQLIAEEA